MNWKNININLQNVETETEKAVLIKMPANSEYKGYSFWHPKKLVRKGKHSYAVSLGYTDEFKFSLKKYGKGKWNKSEVIAEKEITVEEFENAFSKTDKNITAGKTDESYLIVEEPEKIDKEVFIKEELKNDDEHSESSDFLARNGYL